MDENRGAAEPAVIVNEAAEPEAIAEAAGAQAEAAVEIARVEAEAETAIAETQSQAAVEIAEAAIEEGGLSARMERIEAWQQEHGPADHPNLWEAVTLMQAQVQSISETLIAMQTPTEPTAPPHDEAEENPPAEGEAEAGENGPQSSEPPPASEPGEAEQNRPAPAKRHRWI